MDRTAPRSPTIDRGLETRIDREVRGIALMGGPLGELDGRDEPALRKEPCGATYPAVKRDPEIIGRHKRVAAHMETNEIVPANQSRSFDLHEEGDPRANPLDEKVAAFDVEGRPEEEEILVVSAQELGDHSEFINGALVAPEVGESGGARCRGCFRRSEFLP